MKYREKEGNKGEMKDRKWDGGGGERKGKSVPGDANIKDNDDKREASNRKEA